MKILEVPTTITLRLGEDAQGRFLKEFDYSFAEWLRECICSPTAGFGESWEKSQIGADVLRVVRAAKKSEAIEIELEDAWYDALLAAAKAFRPNSEAAIQLAESGYSAALMNPKKCRAEKHPV